jgi:hypothetical protein
MGKIQFQVNDGRLTIAGDQYAYIQGMIRTLWLTVDDLSLHRGFSYDEGKTSREEQIRGIAKIEQGDTLAVAGSDARRTNEVPFSVRAARQDNPASPYERKGECIIVFGFMGADWEIDNQDKWFAEATIPEGEFRELADACKSGKVERISLSCKTDLWVREYDWNTPPSGDVVWYLAPSKNGDAKLPETAYGPVTNFGWSERLEMRHKPQPETPDEPVVGRETDPNEDDPRLILEQQRAKSLVKMVTALNAIGIALAAICGILLFK